jgi:fatty acid-binding protein DegV
MHKVAVVTDSSATIPEHLLQELDIRVVPLLLIFEGQSFRDGVDITPTEVYRWLRANNHLPTTAAPSVCDFLRVYAAAGQEAAGIVSVHLSTKLSSTHDVAVTASGLLDGVPIRVVDCQTAAMGQGFAVLEAARAAAAGASLDQVVSRVHEVASRASLFFALETFEYLHRGGRIGGARRWWEPCFRSSHCSTWWMGASWSWPNPARKPKHSALSCGKWKSRSRVGQSTWPSFTPTCRMRPRPWGARSPGDFTVLSCT